MNEEIMIDDDQFITYDRSKLLEFLKEHKISQKDTNKLLNLIENSYEDEEDVFLKLSYHLKFYEEDTIKDIIETFSILMGRYSIYRGYESLDEWAIDYNDEFELVDFYDYYSVNYFFNSKLEDLFIKELKDNVELGDLKDTIDNLELEELLKTLQEKGILGNLPFSLSPYIYWDKIVNGNFIITFWSDDIIILEQ